MPRLNQNASKPIAESLQADNATRRDKNISNVKKEVISGKGLRNEVLLYREK